MEQRAITHNNLYIIPVFRFIFLIVFPLFLCYIEYMTITQIVEIPANRRITLEVPREIPMGKAKVIVFTQSDKAAQNTEDCIFTDCPLHAENPPFNAKVLAAIEESKAIMKGDIQTKWYNSFEDAQKDLES